VDDPTHQVGDIGPAGRSSALSAGLDPTAEVVQGDRDMNVFVGVDPNRNSTPPMVILHARHVADPFVEQDKVR
jgi:hypothetical protein